MAVLDILTAPEAQRAALGSDGTGHESEIARMTTAISERIDELCGPVVNRSNAADPEYHDGGVMAIVPRLTPVSSVTTLKEWDGTTVTTLTADTWGTAGNADGYRLRQSPTYAHVCTIERRSGGSRVLFASGPEAVELVYVAGRAATTADAPAKFKQVVASILNASWDRDAGRWARGVDPFDGAGMSPGFFDAVTRRVQELLADELKLPGIA